MKQIIGLTGQSGAGKTLVATIFFNNGFFIINADDVSHNLLLKPEIISKITNVFGKEILTNNQIDRRKLGKIVFSDKDELSALNSIMFAEVTKEINNIISKTDTDFIILDAPQLFESKANEMCDIIVSVIAPKDKLIERITERDFISEEDAKKRLSCQHDEEFFKKHSDFVINNKTSIDNLIQNTKEIINKIKEKKSFE